MNERKARWADHPQQGGTEWPRRPTQAGHARGPKQGNRNTPPFINEKEGGEDKSRIRRSKKKDHSPPPPQDGVISSLGQPLYE